MSDHIQFFADAIRAEGIIPLEPVVDTNGQWCRLKIEGDKGAEKTLAYRITIDGDFAFGQFHNHREGITHDWHNKIGRKAAPENKAAHVAKIKAAKEAAEKELIAQQSEAATKAKALWARSKPASHPYLERKGIERGNSRVLDDLLLVPVVLDGNIVSLQTINPQGEKRFISGGKKKGCYNSLMSKSDDLTHIVVCEGFATGVTIRMATGLPVIIAYDAGNLAPVAEVMLSKYPKSNFIFASDNDQWREGGNIGIERAKDALNKVGGQGLLIAPDFEAEHPDRPTDFNDYGNIYGLEAVKLLFQNALAEKVPARIKKPKIVDTDWRKQLIYKRGDEIKPDSAENVRLFLTHDDKYKGLFAYDEFEQRQILHKCPPWEKVPTNFKPRPQTDADITHLTTMLERDGIAPNFEKVRRVVESVSVENKVHPLRDYFDTLKWDGLQRLDNWLTYYCGCEVEDAAYLSAVGRKWLVAAASRIYRAGLKFDYVLVLEGAEGVRKSTLLTELVNFGAGFSCHTAGVRINKLEDKDTVRKTWGKIIVEFSEMAGVGKKDMDELKSWITLDGDSITKKWSNFEEFFPRQFVIAATINPADGWLDDPTGGRRFWPVTCGSIDIESLTRDREQLWAEAIHIARAGREELWLKDDVYKISLDVRDERRITDPWDEIVMHEVSTMTLVSIGDLHRFVGLEISKRGSKEANRLSKIMRRRGWVYKSVRDGSRAPRKMWVKPDVKTIPE